MRFCLAFLPTTERRRPQVATAQTARMMVDAKTIYEPHAIWGMNSSTSMTKAARQTRKVSKVKMNTTRRYLAECDGLCM